MERILVVTLTNLRIQLSGNGVKCESFKTELHSYSLYGEIST